MAMTNGMFNPDDAEELVSKPFAEKYTHKPVPLKLKASEGAHVIKE